MVQAIVLAGGSTNKTLRTLSSAKNEALIEIGSKRMIEYVIDALQQVNKIESITVVGPRELAAFLPTQTILMESGHSILENLQIGLSTLTQSTDQVLILSSDIPFLTGQVINNFLFECEALEADFYYPIITKEVCENRFPQVRRTYVKLKEGVFTGGNIFLLKPGIISNCKKELNEIIVNRKHPLRMLKVLGMFFLIKFLLKKLTINDLEKKVQNLFKINAVAIISNDPELGIDVDKALDLELARKNLG